MQRLFVGTFLAGEAVERLRNLSSANAHLKEKWTAKIRWVAQNKLHLTWVFLGQVENSVIPDLISALKPEIESLKLPSPLILNYDNVELWPNERKARLAVITPQQIPKDVYTIDATIKKALEQFMPFTELRHEKKVFQPHITVLRFARDRQEKACARNGDFSLPSGIFPVSQIIDEIALIESDMGKTEQGYKKLASFRPGLEQAP